MIAATNYDLVTLLHTTLDKRDETNTPTTWRKIKSHSGVQENEREDKLANEARSLAPIPNLEWQLLPRDTISIMHNNIPLFDTEEWLAAQHNDKLMAALKASPKTWWYKINNIDWEICADAYHARWSDAQASFLAQARTGCLRVAATLAKWNTPTKKYVDSPNCPKCNTPQTVQHIPLCDPSRYTKLASDHCSLITKAFPTPPTTQIQLEYVIDSDTAPPVTLSNPPRTVLTIGYYGAAHVELRRTLVTLGMDSKKVYAILRKIVDQVTLTTQLAWKEACFFSHLPTSQDQDI